MKKVVLVILIWFLALVGLIYCLIGLVGGAEAAPELKGLRVYVPVVVHDPVDQEDVLAWLGENSYYRCVAGAGTVVVCRDRRSVFDLPFEATLDLDADARYHLYTDHTLLRGCYPWGLCRQEWYLQP